MKVITIKFTENHIDNLGNNILVCKGTFIEDEFIVVSNSEPIEISDLVYHNDLGVGCVKNAKGTGDYFRCVFNGHEKNVSKSYLKKIIVPKSRTHDNIKNTLIDNLKDNIDVFVECEKIPIGILGMYIQKIKNYEGFARILQKSNFYI